MSQKMQAIRFVMHVAKLGYFIKMTRVGNQIA
jgi:hypothetical protein